MDPTEQRLASRVETQRNMLTAHRARQPNATTPGVGPDAAREALAQWNRELKELDDDLDAAETRLENYRTELRKTPATRDRDTATVGGRIVDKSTGEVIYEAPDEDKGPRKTQAQIDAESAADVTARLASAGASGASAASSAASAARTAAETEVIRATKEADIQKATAQAGESQAKLAAAMLKLREAELLVQRSQQAQERLTAALALDPNDPNRMPEIMASSQEALFIQDPAGGLKEIREQAKWDVEQGFKRTQEEREARRLALEEEKFKASETRATADAAREERQDTATGIRGLMGLEQTRKRDLASAMGQYEQTGISTSGRIGNLQSMSQPVSFEQAAAAMGLDPNSEKARKIFQYGLDAQGQGAGQGGQDVSRGNTDPKAPAAQPRFEDRGQGMGEYYNTAGQSEGLSDIQEPGGNIPAAALQPTPAVLQGIPGSLGVGSLSVDSAPPQMPEEPSVLEELQRRPAVASLYQSLAV